MIYVLFGWQARKLSIVRKPQEDYGFSPHLVVQGIVFRQYRSSHPFSILCFLIQSWMSLNFVEDNVNAINEVLHDLWIPHCLQISDNDQIGSERLWRPDNSICRHGLAVQFPGDDLSRFLVRNTQPVFVFFLRFFYLRFFKLGEFIPPSLFGQLFK